ncbi:MAG: glycosyltransferase family 4 protein, partial [Anaerolineales bacterium]
TERKLSFLIDSYVANSKGAIRFLSSRGLPAEKLHWIPSGIDSEGWPVPQRSDRSTSIIACVARFVPVKRHIDLIQALGLLMQAGVPFRCVLVGEGPLLRGIQSKAEEVGLGEFITFPGRINPDAVRELLTKADLFVLPSAWEGLPSSVMEAMAAGLPVVGTDVNGINELVVDGETGLLVPPENPESLADALASMLKGPAMRQEMGAKGRKRIEARFDLRKTTLRIEQFYETILDSDMN